MSTCSFLDQNIPGISVKAASVFLSTMIEKRKRVPDRKKVEDRPFGKDELHEMAKDIHAEGFKSSEAYPISRWKKNGWPDIVDIRIFRILDSMIALLRSEEEYFGKK